ncbi:MAG: hypothetical protein ACI8XC_000174 [Gammaproteobacteria bacterium]|jgi:hypothetical protein
MMKSSHLKNGFLLLIFTIVTVILLTEPALAGPGGKIARSLFDSLWGKLLLALLTIIFLPLIVLNVLKEKRAERRARKDLVFMSQYDDLFEWISIKQRISDCFYRTHQAWQKEDMQQASEWMTSWYWQNQQSVYIEEWSAKGLINICKIKALNDIKPLLLVHRNHEKHHQDSILIVSVKARLQDYLMEKDGSKIVEGNKKYKNIEQIWSFTLDEGMWKASNIEERASLDDYLKQAAHLPKIENTLNQTQ